MIAETPRFLIFRNGSIGNTLAAVPALRALRNRYPNAFLAVVVDPVGRQLLEHCPWINQLIVYHKHGEHRGLIAYCRIVKTLRSIRPTHAILLKRFFRNGLLAFLSGASTRIGFDTDGRHPFLNVTLPYCDNESVIDQNLSLVELLEAPSIGRQLELFLSEDDHRQATEFIARHLSDSRYVVVHYGGDTTSPSFVPLPRFVELCRFLTPQRTKFFVIGTGESERRAADQICELDSSFIPAIDLPIRTSASLIAHSSSFIGFNSGPAHIAAASGVPTRILYEPNPSVHDEIRKWCPPGTDVRALIPPASAELAAWNEFLTTVVPYAVAE